MKNFIHLAWIFIRRDFRSAKPTQWLFRLSTGSLAVVAWWWVIRFFTQQVHPGTTNGSRGYFAYSVVGLAFSQCVWQGTAFFSARLKQQKNQGWLEMLWTARYPFPLLIIFSGLWDFVFASVNMGLTLAVGFLGFGIPFEWTQVFEVAGIAFLTCFAMSSLSLFSLACDLMDPRIDQAMRPFLNRLVPILCGALFPVTAFPGWLKGIALFFPLTHGLALVQGILLPHSPVRLTTSWTSFVSLTCGFILLNWYFLKFALNRARTSGQI